MMGRVLTVRDTLEDTYEFVLGDYLELKVVWHSEQEKRYCFIFTDREDSHIGGVLRKFDHNTSNFYQKLKSKPNYFQIMPTKIEENDHIQSRLVRNNPKQLLLSNSTMSPQLKVLEKTPNEFPKHLPFDFTTLDDIDECNVGDVIDIIGCITSTSDVQESKNGTTLYQRVEVRSSRSTIDGYQREVALFGPFLEKVKGKNSVFAFMNLKVNEFEKALGANKTLQIFGSTIILKIEREDLSILPPKYREEQFVLDLFPKKRATTNKSLQSSTASVPTQKQEPKHENAATTNQNLFTFKAFPNTFSTFSSSSSTSSGFSSGSSIFGGTMNENTQNENAAASSSNVVKRLASVCENSLEPPKRQCIITEPITDSTSNEVIKNSLSIPVKKYNFTRNTDLKRLEVVMRKSTTSKSTDSNCYRMENGGAALIIHNYYFPHKKGNADDKNRHGSLRDVEIFTTLFKKLGIDVETRHDVKATELPKILDDFKSRFREDTDVCFVVVLSHGANDLVEMHDGYCIPLPNDIIHQFDDIAFPEMKGKPKIFFVQACQRIVSKTKQYLSVMPDRSQDVELNDAIVIKAAISGTSAVRNYNLGSPFAYVFVDTCMEYASDHDFVTIITSVEERLPEVEHEGRNKLQCQKTLYHFKKKLFFNPKKIVP